MSNSFGAKGNLQRQTTSGQGGGGVTSRAPGGLGGGGGGCGGGDNSRAERVLEREGEGATSELSGASGSSTIKRRPQAELAERRADTFDEQPPPAVALTLASGRRPASGGSGPAGSLSGGKIVSPSGTTSNTQRLSSIEILNENKQRQLQLEQQESFKQHLELRQRFIQLQHQQEQAQQELDSQLADQLNSCSAYRVDTSAPEYVRMAAAAANRKSTGSGAPMNPFNEEAPREEQPATVSGRSGFLSTLMGEDTQTDKTVSKTSNLGGQGDVESGDDAESSSGETRAHDSAAKSRYCKLAAQAGSSYNYSGGGGDDRPFYQKDIATLLSECRGSRKLVILIVAVALLLDNMLLTTVVPIIPAYLYKLRVVREHRQLLATGSGRTNNSAPSDGAQNKLQSAIDINGDGRVDEDELQAELDRRINQSLAKVQDRFSGSFFHPRVLKPRDKFGNIIGPDEEDDDDDQDDDDRDDERPRNGRGRSKGRGGRNQDDEDDERDFKGGRKRVRERRAEPGDQKSSRKSQLSSGGVKMSPAEMEDDYETTNDNENDDDDAPDGGNEEAPALASNSQNGKMDRENSRTTQRFRQAAATVKAQQSSTTRPPPGSTTSGGKLTSRGLAASRPASGTADKGGPAAAVGAASQPGRGSKNDESREDDDDDDDDDDDEDSTATRKWNRLKSSLKEMAARSGNDSETLGGMCVSMVLDRPNYFNRRMGKGRSKDKDDGDNDQDDNEQPPAKSRAGKPDQMRRPSSSQRRPKVDRLRPGPRMRNGDKDEDEEKKQQQQEETPKEGDTGRTMIGDDEVIINHQDIVDESFEVGVMFASKPIVQALANPFVGAITNRVGFTLPMFLGFTIMFLSTLVFAFGETYATLFMARAIQGIGSACTSVAGMSMIADRFPDDAERGNAMAVALGGLALGVVIGPPFGGFMYEFFGKPTPFIVLAILALLDGLLQLLVLQPRVSKCQDEGASLMTLIKDPYILVAAGAITFANTGIGILEPALPLWMMDTMQAKNWEQGVAFLPAALSYLFSTNLFGNLGLRIGRWRSAMLGLIIIGCSLLLIPFASRVDHLILPNGAIGFAIGMVDSTMMPMLGYLVDIRHTSVYGSVYAIGDVAFCASFVFGPALSGTLVELIGFEGLIITTALICFAFAPLLVLLRDPPVRQANEAQLQEQSTLRYVNYNHLDSPGEEAQHLTRNATATTTISTGASNMKPASSTAR